MHAGNAFQPAGGKRRAPFRLVGAPVAQQRPAQTRQPVAVLYRRARHPLRTEQRDDHGAAGAVQLLLRVAGRTSGDGIQRARLRNQRQPCSRRRQALMGRDGGIEGDVVVDAHAAREEADPFHDAAQALRPRHWRHVPLDLRRVRQERLEGTGIVARGKLARGRWPLGHARQHGTLLAIEREGRTHSAQSPAPRSGGSRQTARGRSRRAPDAAGSAR